MSGMFARMNARRRERFDLKCWELRSRGYSLEYIADRTGATVFEVQGAVRRVGCGRYGDVPGRGER